MKITDKLLNQLLKMSKLVIESKKERDLLKNQLSETLSYIENLEELNTEKVDPAYFSSEELKNQYFKDGEKNVRGLKRKEVLKLAREVYENFFKVKRVIK